MDAITKDKVLEILGDFWLRVFADQDTVDALATAIATLFSDLADQSQELAQLLSRRTVPVRQRRPFQPFVLREHERLNEPLRYTGTVLYGTPVVYGQLQDTGYCFSYPLPRAEVVPQYLTSAVVDATVILTRGIDFQVSQSRLFFKEDPLTNAAVSLTVQGNPTDPQLSATLWGFGVEEDMQYLASLFGLLAGVCGISSAYLKEAVNLAWDLRTVGATANNLRRLLNWTVGISPYNLVDGEQVISIEQEGATMVVCTSRQVITAPAGVPVAVQPGDVLSSSSVVFAAWSIARGTQSLPFEQFEGLLLGPDYVAWLPPRHSLLFGNALVPTSFDGQWRFPVGGTDADVQRLILELNTPVNGRTFFTGIMQRHGVVPPRINPLQELHDEYLRGNATYIRVSAPLLDARLAGQLFNVLRQTWPAGASFFVLLQYGAPVEQPPLNMREEVALGYAVEYSESLSVPVREQPLPTLV